MAGVQHGFGVKFDEAIQFLKGKLPESSVAWDSLAGPVHAKVFTVAGATTADLAADLQASLVQALEQGQTIAQFRRGFDAAVEKHGWAYNGKRGWRSSIIFDTNMRSAHMAGRWAQIEANKDRRPFLQYRTAGDARVRPMHRQWNGLVFPVDDAFWRTHYPPNGWNCRCTVRSYSADDLAERNLQVSKPVPLEMRTVSGSDGTVTDVVPKGIDPGWDHNVGQAWINPELALGHKLARLPRDLQGAVVDKTITPAFQQAIGDRWKAFRTGVEGASKVVANPQAQAQIVGFLDSATLNGMARSAPGVDLNSTAVAAFDAADLSGWPADWVDNLPAELRNYRAVLWDKANGQLVVVPAGTLGEPGAPRRFATASLKPNQISPLGEALSLQSLGSAAPADLADRTRYDILVGRIN